MHSVTMRIKKICASCVVEDKSFWDMLLCISDFLKDYGLFFVRVTQFKFGLDCLTTWIHLPSDTVLHSRILVYMRIVLCLQL